MANSVKDPPQRMSYTQLMLLFACAIKKLGGSIEVTQTQIDEVAYGRVIESWDPDKHSMTYTLDQKSRPTN